MKTVSTVAILAIFLLIVITTIETNRILPTLIGPLGRRSKLETFKRIARTLSAGISAKRSLEDVNSLTGMSS
uniref:Peptide Ctri9819 n=1 Tax=Chaerilus tricostatus TaxID=1055734 RepID=NDB4R_CHATC|nr:RecName: Full=Peptide Ctri9819; Flags: Precursor [Chaerilus tricostatus]